MAEHMLVSMKLIDKYLIRNFLGPFFYCLLAFFMISIVYDVSVNLDTFIDKKIGLKTLVDYYMLLLPVILANTMPIAVLMGILYELGNLQRSNEITGLRASGISNARIMMPFMLCGLCISLISFLIEQNFVPQALYKINIIETQRFKKEVEKEKLLKVTAFYNIRANRSWVGTIDLTTPKILDFEVREFDRQGTVARKITARELSHDAKTKLWTFRDGKIYYYTAGVSPENETAKEKFATMTFDFSETPADLINSQKEAMYMSAAELRTHLKTHPKDSKIYTERKVDLYYKFASPFVSFIVMLIGLAFGMRTTRGGLLIGVGTSLAIFIAYYGLSIVSLAMGKQELMPPWLAAWLPNMFFTALGVTFLSKMN